VPHHSTELSRHPVTPKIIILTTFDIDEHAHAALRAGAVGFLLKDTPPRDLAEAVRVVAAGNAMLSPTVTRRLISAFAVQARTSGKLAHARLAALTERELAVVCAVGRGCPTPRSAASRRWPRRREGARQPGAGQARPEQPGAGRDPGPRGRLARA
jgi:DNA-binding NarL/FixJ family response regulator